MSIKEKIFSSYTLSVITGGIILCYLAFFNHYPFVYSDTGAFIAAAAERNGFNSARFFYSFFIRQVSMRETLFLVVFAQGLVISWLIHLLFQHFGSSTYKLIWTQFAIIILTLFTGVSFHVGQIMADIFTAISVLSLILILFAGDFKKSTRIFICALFVYSNISHQTHPVIMLLTLSVMGSIFFFIRRSGKAVNWRRYFLALILAAISWLILPTANLICNHKFIYSESTFMYRMSGLIEMGILQSYLEENCSEHNYSLCQYVKDDKGVFWNFLWSESSPANQNGGWQAHREEYTQLMNDLFSKQKYVKLFIRKSNESAFQQFFCFDSGETTAYLVGSAPYGAISWHFSNDMRQYTTSKQNTKQIDFTLLNHLQVIVVFFSIFVLMSFVLLNATGEKNILFRLIVITLFAALFINAYMCSVFSTVADRFQSRVVWLIPLFALVLISNKVGDSNFIKRIANRFANH